MRARIETGWIAALAASALLASCGGGGGGGDSPSPAPSTFTIGGSVTGLTGTGLVLQNNGGGDLQINASGNFTFATALSSGSTYAVTVRTQPTGQHCTVGSGSGTVGNAAVTNVAVTCGPQRARFLVVPNFGSDTVGVYAINPQTGALTAVNGSPWTTGAAPAIVSVHPDDGFVFVAGRGSASAPPGISAFAVNGDSGALTPVAGSPFELSHAQPLPNGAVTAIYQPLIRPDGKVGYISVLPSDKVYGAGMDPATGVLSEIGGMPQFVGMLVGSMTFGDSGNRLYVPHNSVNPMLPNSGGAVELFEVAAGGTLTHVGGWPTNGTNPTVARLNADGSVLVVAHGTSGTVASFKVDTGAGTLTPAPGSPYSTGNAANAVTHVIPHPTRDFVFATNSNGNGASSIAAWTVDRATGTLTPVAGSPFPTGGTGALLGAIDPSGRYFYVSNRGTDTIAGFSIDQDTGVLAALPGSPYATGDAPSAAILDPSGRFLFVPNTDSNTVSAWAIDANDGRLTLVNTVNTGTAPGFGALVGLQ